MRNTRFVADTESRYRVTVGSEQFETSEALPRQVKYFWTMRDAGLSVAQQLSAVQDLNGKREALFEGRREYDTLSKPKKTYYSWIDVFLWLVTIALLVPLVVRFFESIQRTLYINSL